MFIIGKRAAVKPELITFAAIPVVHKSQVEAMEEAERLAKKNVGWEYIVFNPIFGIQVQPVYQTITNREF